MDAENVLDKKRSLVRSVTGTNILKLHLLMKRTQGPKYDDIYDSRRVVEFLLMKRAPETHLE